MSHVSESRSTHRPRMVIYGLPLTGWLSRSGAAQISVLRLHWNILFHPEAPRVVAKSGERPSLLERLYRLLDRRLFGRGRWLASFEDLSSAGVEPLDAAAEEHWQLSWRREALAVDDSDRLCIEYEGRPMSELEQAVRDRLGQPGGMLWFRVWLLRSSQSPRLLVEGRLRLDHRSLWRSVVQCAAKLPALLRAAEARRDRPEHAPRLLEARSQARISAARQIWRLFGTSLTWILYREQWQLEISSVRAEKWVPTGIVSVLRPPNSVFWADPFLLRRGERNWVLFEELPFDTNRGHISAVEVDNSGNMLSEPRVVLKEPWHLSYPFIWCDESRVYMIPEAGANRELALYELIGDRQVCLRRATLISGLRLADATIARFEGCLWMFATSADSGAFMDDTLHIFWAVRIDGPWHPHTLNPVKIDASSARPAGSMWVAGGSLYRVVQDCSSTYGGSVRCMRVVRLTRDEFEEEPVTNWTPLELRIENSWHTFNEVGSLRVIDRLVRLPRWLR